jgi:hypothetical protein
MFKKLQLLAFLFSPILMFAQNSIKGNVFYKYNDFVGNKADAGSTVYLFYSDNNKKYQETKCDLAGNFAFENLDTGNYLIAVLSENVRQFAERHAREYKYINSKKYFGVEIDKSLFDSIDIYKKNYDQLIASRPNKKKQLKEWESKMEIVRSNYIGSDRIIENYLDKSTPYKKDLSFPLFEMGGKALYLKEVGLNNQNKTATIIVDYGLAAF